MNLYVRERTPTVRRNLVLLLGSSIYFFMLFTPAVAQNVGNETSIQNWLRCAVDTYKEKRELMTFDRDALTAAWSGCSAERDAVVKATPAEQRELISRTLEGINDSVIAEIVAADNQHPGYGLNREQAIMVGGGWQEGVQRALLYLSKMRDAKGETPIVTRIGSCCAFQTANAINGRQGRLEVYDLTFKSSKNAITVYVNTYDEGNLNTVAGLVKINE